MYIEILIVAAILIFVFIYRKNADGNSYRFINKTFGGAYEKYAPYSFKVVREKAKELGQEYTTRQYIIQVAVFNHVFHQLHGLLENVGIDSLQDILFIGICGNMEGIVDMPVTEGLTDQRSAFDAELVNGLFHRILRSGFKITIYYNK